MKIDDLLKEIEGYKQLVWHDDDWVELGYNRAIDDMKWLVGWRIVTCKDCKHAFKLSLMGIESDKYYCKQDEDNHEPEWYCADGVRRDGET